MKKLLTLALVALFFASCSKDDNYIDSKIVGKWQRISMSPRIISASHPEVTKLLTSYFTEYYNETKLGYQFLDNKTVFSLKYIRLNYWEARIWTVTNKGTYSFKKNKLILNNNVIDIQFSDDTFSIYMDVTNLARDYAKDSFPKLTNLVVAKVIIEYKYTRIPYNEAINY